MRLTTFEPTLLANFKSPLITIYNSPKDFPEQYVARLFDLNNATPYYVVESTYNAVKNTIPTHMQRFERDPNDDPVIVEVWI